MKVGSWTAYAIVAISSAPIQAQVCEPLWSDAFANRTFNGSVHALKMFDFGQGPELYAGGQFTIAGGVPAAGVARFDGEQWHPLGTELSSPGNPSVWAMKVFDDGKGASLYVGGGFTSAGGEPSAHIARWTGAMWEVVGGGVDNHVFTMAVHDDGSGPALYVGGTFDSAGGIPAKRIARWNGAEWSSIGDISGVLGSPVRAMISFDDGSGPALYVGGDFTHAGGVPSHSLARWRGTWEALPAIAITTGTQKIHAFEIHDRGFGPELYVGGSFSASFKQVARWTGTGWQTFPTIGLSALRTLLSYDDGNERALYAGSHTTGLAVFDGAAWSVIPETSQVRSLVAYTGAGGGDLVAGGDFGTFGGESARSIAIRRNGQWSALQQQEGLIGLGGEVAQEFEGEIYVGGRLHFAGGKPVSCLARWNGAEWNDVGGGVHGGSTLSTQVRAMAVFDDGSGEAMYIAGKFTQAGGAPAIHLTRWDGTNLMPLPGFGMSDELSVLLDGSELPQPFNNLYVAGRFTHAGGYLVNSIARWDGQQWQTLGGGVLRTNELPGDVHAMSTHDGGYGAQLYITGHFVEAGGMPANSIARWDGQQWRSLGGGLTQPHHAGGHVAGWGYALVTFDDGSGPALYVTGTFTEAGGVASPHLARWRNQTWEEVPSPLTRYGTAMTTMHDGARSLLVLNGQMPGGVLIAWDGQSWFPLHERFRSGENIQGLLTVERPGGAQSLFVTGGFAQMASHDSGNFAELRGCHRCFADCDNNGDLNVNDFTCFINEFAAAMALPVARQVEHYANCDSSTVPPVLNVEDLMCFINAFAAGCP